MFLLRCLNDAITRFNLVPESGSAEDCDKGEVGGIEVFPMLRLGDGSRFPSLGSEPFVFILGPWAMWVLMVAISRFGQKRVTQEIRRKTE